MKDEKVFGRVGLNLDDDPRYFGVNDTDLIQNMLPNVDGGGGIEETCPGNIQIPTSSSYGGDIRVVGTCKDVKTNYVYIFIRAASPLDGNSILQYDPISETYRQIVVEEVYLPMGEHVYGAVVFGDYIIYNTLTDGLRKVHIDYANRYYNIDLWVAGVYQDGDLVRRPDGSCYVCILDTVIGDGAPEAEPTHWAFEYYTYPSVGPTTFVLRNMPPIDAPTFVYATDGGRSRNQLLKKTFQFAYRYKYVDGGYSVYSEYSDIALPPNVETWNGGYEFGLFSYNLLTVSFTRGDPALVEYVELVVREGNDGAWRFLATIDEDVNSFDFYNDENYEAIDQDEILKSEDAVPIRVADMALINENRLVVAGCTEGFDNIVPDVLLTPAVETITIETLAEAAKATRYLNDQSGDEHYYSINTSDLATPADYAVGNILRISLRMIGETRSVDHVLTAPEVVDLEHLVWAIVDQIDILLGSDGTVGWVDPPGSAAVWNVIDTGQYDIEIELTPGSHNVIYNGSISFVDASVVENANKWNTYKSGASHPHAIQYWDEEFRRSTIMRSPACDVLVGTRGDLGISVNYRVKIDWEIFHTAPSWARYWSWVYAGNKTQSSFVQYIISAVDSTLAAPNDSYLGLNITPLQLLKTDDASITSSMPSSVIDPYVFAPGDRVRFIAAENVGGTDFGVPFSGSAYYDLPVVGLSDNMLLVPLPTGGGTYGIGAGSLIEIYTPRTFIEDSELYYTVGGINSVIGGYHMNPSGVSQDALTPASGTLESGDAYLIARAFSVALSGGASSDMYAVESMHWSDFYQSDAYDEGKPNIISSIGEVTQNNIRWGLRHLVGASVNNMFTFDALDYKTTTEIYGDLERIGECGDVLRLLFNKKVASMYIGKTEYIDTEGSSVVATSNNVLSNPNYSIDDYGTTVPEAVLFVKGIVYFIDLYNGAIVRSTNNGSYPISGRVEASEDSPSYKMNSYFRNICNKVLDAQLLVQGGTTEGNTLRMLLGWDNGRKLLYVSILSDAIESRTSVFSEDRGRWVGFLDFYQDTSGLYPTAYEWVSGKFFSFLDTYDSVWDHSSPSATPLFIYGEDKIATISVWSVVHPNKTKVFDSIALHTNVPGWYGRVFIPPSLSYPAGMESRLFAANFKKRENALYTEYMFNGLSAGNTFSMRGLYNGESLRGYVIENRLSIATAARLFKIDVNYRLSSV